MAKILIVDDDPAIVALLEDVLERDYLTVFASDGRAALHQLAVEKPDLILLDLRMPDMDGSVLLPRIRALSTVPVIVLSARAEQADRVLALKAGADDFIAKPFDIDDLLTRVEAVLRRSRRVARSEFIIGNLVISPGPGTVTVGDRRVDLTPTEWRILIALAAGRGVVQSYASLSLAAYNYETEDLRRLISIHVMHIRAKLCRSSTQPPLILNRHGQGYALVPNGGP